MYSNFDHMKCWVWQTKFAPKVLLTLSDGTGEQVAPNSNHEKKDSAWWALLGSLLEMTRLKLGVFTRWSPEVPSSPRNSMALWCFLWKRKLFLLLCFISHSLPSQHLESFFSLTIISLFLSFCTYFPFHLYFLFSLSPIFSPCSVSEQ